MSGRILIADAVATNRIIMKVKLSAAHYNVIQASSASTVMRHCAQGAPDLIILDTDLPGTDGISLCRSLRADPSTTNTPIIVISSKGNQETRMASLEAGADEFMTKPLDELATMARIRNLLRARVVGDELRLREGTALELGFSETPATFQHTPHIGLIAPNEDVGQKWLNAISADLNASVETLKKGQALGRANGSMSVPDVFVLATDIEQPGDGLTLLAELRSRIETRHAAIVVVHESDQGKTAAAALDMGANDALPANGDAAEMALRVRRQITQKLLADRLRSTVENGLKLAMTDPLTGLFNRRYAVPHLSRISARAQETGRGFAIMVLDMDHFKRINDSHGHSAGDAVLTEVAKRIKSNTRSVDLVARIGGEEFLVVMPETDLANAQAAAERLRHVVSATPIDLPDGKTSVIVTLSIGLSIGGRTGIALQPVENLVDQADRALLGAKAQGRNKVTIGKSAA